MPQPLSDMQERLAELLESKEGWVSTTALAQEYYGADRILGTNRDSILQSLKALRLRGVVVGQKKIYKAKNRSRTGKHRERKRRKFWVWQLNPDRDKRRKFGVRKNNA